MDRQISPGKGQLVQHQGREVRLVPTRVGDLKTGDVVIGPCGHERAVRKIVDGSTGVRLVVFRETAKFWNRPIDDEVFVVVREHG